jgi:hypothetical protein
MISIVLLSLYAKSSYMAFGENKDKRNKNLERKCIDVKRTAKSCEKGKNPRVK